MPWLCNAFIVQCLYRAMPLSCNAFIVQCLYRVMPLSCDAFIVQCLYRAMPLWCNALIVQCLDRAMTWSYNAFIVQCLYRAMPWSCNDLIVQLSPKSCQNRPYSADSLTGQCLQHLHNSQCRKYGRGWPEQLANSLIVAARRLCMSLWSVYICRRLAEEWRHRRYDVTMVL